MTHFLKNLWIKLFGTTEWAGLNIGFWISMLAVALLVVIMVVVFWTMKPKNRSEADETENPPTSNAAQQNDSDRAH